MFVFCFACAFVFSVLSARDGVLLIVLTLWFRSFAVIASIACMHAC